MGSVMTRALSRWGWVLAAVLALTACQPEAQVGDITLVDILNNVRVSTAEGGFEEAKSGVVIVPGTEIQSTDNSLARLAFSGGPSVRLSSNTTLALEAPPTGEDVRLRLAFGRLRLSLFGLRFGISTPMGLLHLRGFGEVLYLPGLSPDLGDDTLSFRCFSGPCEVALAGGTLALDNLETVVLTGGGQTTAREPLTELDLRQFLADNPGSVGLIATLTAEPTETLTPTPVTPSPTASHTAPPPTATPAITDTPAPTATNTRAPVTPRPLLPTATATVEASPTSTETAPPSGGGGGGGNPPTDTPAPPTAPPPTATPAPPTPEPTVTESPSKTPSP